jgi:hypothetical protein
MKPHPRIRKTIKWGGTAVTVLLVVVWIGSGWLLLSWGGVTYSGNYWHLAAYFGRVEFVSFPAPGSVFSRPHIEAHPYPGRFEWGFQRTNSLDVPIWAIVACVVPCTLFAWRLDSPSRCPQTPNLCPKCGYDRTGIFQDAKCPECGTVPASV